MKLRHWAIGGSLLALGIGIGVALSQPVVIQALTGNEAVLYQLGGPGGTGGFTTVGALRNGKTFQVVSGGTTVNTSLNAQVGVAMPQSAITTWVVQFPLAPYDGQTVRLMCPLAAAATVSMVVIAPTSTTGSAYTACGPGGGTFGNPGVWTYYLSNNTWLRTE